MRKLRLAALAAVSVLAAAGCTTAYNGDRYQAAQHSGDYGYSEQRLEDNRYRVNYRTENDRYLAEDFAMRRSAELTLDRRYDWFQVISRNRAVSDDMFRRYDQYASKYGDSAASSQDRPAYGSVYGEGSGVAVLDIVMGNDPPPRGANVYNAREVLQYRSDDRGYSNN